ncbi:hypothetical protein COV58_00570 [Candidatus Roizmanbacteria bacterium CG11_big_fil_rev_8_21_14_0_20_36_8]|uniref:Transcription regulator TrmB N-terminal domain-containing protein n=2 Tax=Candidatus Roizmaniibacteriota TaxID=1752723 RepID=A0A2M6IVF5_9BACT|nr:MAG: hypothetical protein COV58_00570 [Candidatus Roizmanbacteria bacterium CG11_big_fil_rev_8_21_14_0_20_36_8]PIZ64839.1 MAG: hypothetical protein COY14_03815 [Candidatus Roizmanbacteria bacterium CG_4_10_14_0_2_um_filter_36_9]
MFEENLKALGLADEEINIYLTALEEGSVTILQIARMTKIPRSTVYLYVDSLIKKRLLKGTVMGKKKLYIPASPKELVKLAEEKKKLLDETVSSLQENLSQLQTVYDISHKKPKIRYYEGVEEVKKIYEDSLSVEKIYVHCMSQKAIPLMKGYIEEYMVRMIRRMIHTKEIVSDSTEDKKYQEEYSTSRNQIICIPSKFITNTDYFIYGDNVAFITYKDSIPVGVVISDPEIVHFEKIRFMMIWEKFLANNQL